MALTRHRHRLKSEINIIPLLDVLLVLLLVVIATTPIISQSIKVELSDALQSEIDFRNNVPIILEVVGVGQYSVNVNTPFKERFLSLEQIAAITRIIQVKNPRAIFLIGGIRNVPYEEVIKLLNILHQASIKSIGMITHPI